MLMLTGYFSHLSDVFVYYCKIKPLNKWIWIS